MFKVMIKLGCSKITVLAHRREHLEACFESPDIGGATYGDKRGHGKD
jgi:hypothetical protein